MRLDACTAQRHNGDFCDAPSMVDVPFPICKRHAEQLILHLTGETIEGRALRLMVEEQAKSLARKEEFDSEQEVRARRMAEQSLVYYVRIGDHIKIGYTINMLARLSSLRIDEPALLATEPGGRELERQRHNQFKAERVSKREDFHTSPRLLEHIDQVVAEHGPPVVTTYRSGWEPDVIKTRPAKRENTRTVTHS